MAMQSLLPAGHFRPTYAADTVIFPTSTSRYAALAGLVLLGLAPLALSQYWLSVLIQIGYLAIAALGLNIVVGFTGQISIGHAVFFGLGAFTSAYLNAKLSIPVFFAIPLAALITALAGLLFGLPAAISRSQHSRRNTSCSTSSPAPNGSLVVLFRRLLRRSASSVSRCTATASISMSCWLTSS
jgi:hypothetical protein